MKHKIWMEELPATENYPVARPAAWYGDVPGVSINKPIYCRVDNESDAYEFKAQDAFTEIRAMRSKGYSCRAVPPITVTY